MVQSVGQEGDFLSKLKKFHYSLKDYQASPYLATLPLFLDLQS
jgi:hypothetical protein